jgi:hypothetical protein
LVFDWGTVNPDSPWQSGGMLEAAHWAEFWDSASIAVPGEHSDAILAPFSSFSTDLEVLNRVNVPSRIAFCFRND